MQERQLFEYAVVRVVPRVEREEFINVGVILYCAGHRFLRCKISFDFDKLAAFAGKVDAEQIWCNLKAIDKICCGGLEGGPIGELDVASRFRWLTATRSTVVQTSKVHPGFCIEAEETLQQLYEKLVL